jgi:hypothetical protein
MQRMQRIMIKCNCSGNGNRGLVLGLVLQEKGLILILELIPKLGLGYDLVSTNWNQKQLF